MVDTLPITPDELRTDYLFGLGLTDDEDEPYPDSLYDRYIRAAVASLEGKLDILLAPRDFTGDDAERHDWDREDAAQWSLLHLYHLPVIEVLRVRYMFPGGPEEGFEFPKSWIAIEKHSGRLTLRPGQGSITQWLLSFNGGNLALMNYGGASWFPELIRVDYRAGYRRDDIPADALHAIGMMASIPVLAIAGDLIAGAGVASKSLSIDGLSQSIATTSSATNSGYGARIIEYRNELKTLVPDLRSRLRGPIALVV